MTNSVLPEVEEDSFDDESIVDEEIYPNTTWILNEEEKTIGATSDDLEVCARQAAKIALRTEQQVYEAYSIDFGSRLNELIGETAPHVYAEIEHAIRECVMNDDRVDGVSNFRFSNNEGDIMVRFDMSVSGEDIEMVTEVDINGD